MIIQSKIIQIGTLLALGVGLGACGLGAEYDEASADPESVEFAASAETCSLAGPWSATWSAGAVSFSSPLTLTHTGNNVAGRYEIDPQNRGEISGTLTGNQFRGEWRRTAGASVGPYPYGDLELTVAANCNSVTGRWWFGHTGDPNFAPAGPVTGTRGQ